MDPGVVYVVATPVGHLDDVTARALDVLRTVDVVASEDTRRTRVLLAKYGIDRTLVAYHAHNESRVVARLLADVLAGKSIALVSDAGTPCLSDPGQVLVDACHAQGIRLVPIPGPSAITAALSVAGLDNSRFLFEGFLPREGRLRREAIARWRALPYAVVLFEAPPRVAATLEELCESLGHERRVLVARELTKLHEQLVRGSLGEVRDRVARGEIPALGEFVLVLEPAAAAPRHATPDARTVLRERLAYLSPSQASRLAARLTGLPRGELYDQALALGGAAPAEADAEDDAARGP